MRAVTRWSAILFITALTILPAAASKPTSLYNKGVEAEARQDYEAAYDFYRRAYEANPKDLRLRASYDRMRFLAAASHVHRGQQMVTDGKLVEAQAEFELAIKIDPSGSMAPQQLKRVREMIALANNPSQLPIPSGVSEKTAKIAGPVELLPLNPQPVTMRMTAESKVIYSAIGKLAGLNVLFDPDYNAKSISVDLNGVSLSQALEILALQSHTFWRAITPNTIYVTTDTAAKRKELEPQALKTFYLANTAVNTDINDVVNALRTVLDIKFAQAMPNQGAVVVRGTPDQLALAEKLINDIDKARPEVVVDIAILQVSREKSRSLGVATPFTSSTTNPSVSLQSLSTTTSGTTTTTSGLTFKDLTKLSMGSYALTLPSTTVEALMSNSDTKLLDNPQIRSVDGQKATLKIGKRIPTATGSTGATTGSTVSTSYLVSQTSFQYIDVGVNIEITPHVHANRDVSLKVSLEVSSHDSDSIIAGVTEPIIGQKKYENEIWIKDGEECLMGGMYSQTDSKSMSGMPWLAQVPILKYFFGQQAVDKLDSELVIALTPHVVRAQDVEEINTRAVGVGTANNVNVHYNQPIIDAPVAVPSSAPQTQPQSQQQQTQRPPQSQSATPAPVAGQGAVLGFDSPVINQKAGDTFSVNITLTGGQNIAAMPVQMRYDPKILQLVNVSNGNLFSHDGQMAALVHREDAAKGTAQISISRPPGAPGIAGDGSIAFTLTFAALKRGESALVIDQAQLRDTSAAVQPVNTSQAVVTIR